MSATTTATTPRKQFDSDIKSRDASRAMTPTLVPLTAQQNKEWDMTRSALLWSCPAFTHLLYSIMAPKSGGIAIFTKDVPIAATDGLNLFLNPETFFKYSLSERVFIVAHEIMHCVLDHCGMSHALKRRGKVAYPSGKFLPYEDEMMNVATDLVINDLLIQSKVGTFNKDWLHDTNLATGQDSAIDAYAKVFKRQQGGGGGKGQGQGQGQGKGQGQGQQRFDQHLPPGTGQGKDPDTGAQDRNPVEWKTAVAGAAAAAKAQGKLPAALERFFGSLLEPTVSWSEKIQTFFARKVGSGSSDWRRPDRRLIVRDIYAPGRSGFGAGTVIVGFDTSGSIYADAGLIDRFLAEMGGILNDVRPKRLVVVWCDAQVHRTDEIDEMTDLQGLKPVGGGGTMFTPVFDWITQEGIEPDALVYLTDGDGGFPASAPAYPVLWGDISGRVEKYPFGEVVVVPKQ